MLNGEIIVVRRVAITGVVAVERAAVTKLKDVPMALLCRNGVVEFQVNRQPAEVRRRNVTIKIVNVRRRLAARGLIFICRRLGFR